jgi:hypothetical protein
LDFELSEDQKMLYRVTREFAKEELRPKARYLTGKLIPWSVLTGN